MKEIKYKEVQYNYVLMFLYAIYFMLMLVVLVSSGFGNNNVGLGLSFMITFLLLSFFVYMLGRMKITLTSKHLHIEMGFGFSKQHLEVEAINKESMKVDSLPWWFGVGHKQANGNRTFFRIGFGSLISFICQGEKYFLSVRNPDDFFKAIAS
jgi:hypothetical protein